MPVFSAPCKNLLAFRRQKKKKTSNRKDAKYIVKRKKTSDRMNHFTDHATANPGLPTINKAFVILKHDS